MPSLFLAVQHENVDDLQSALKNGANVNAVNENGDAPLHVIAAKSFRSEPHFEVLTALLKAGANVNQKNKAGLTPIQVALQSGWQDTAAFLYEAGSAKVDKELLAETRITCGDCKKLVESWEHSKFQRPEQGGPRHDFVNSKYNHTMPFEESIAAAAAAPAEASSSHHHAAHHQAHHVSVEEAAHAAAKHRDMKLPSA